MFGEVCAAFLHLDEHDWLPDVIGEGSAAAVFGRLADAHLGGAADVERASLAERAEEVI